MRANRSNRTRIPKLVVDPGIIFATDPEASDKTGCHVGFARGSTLRNLFRRAGSKNQSELMLMKSALKKFFGQLREAVRQAPSYSDDTQTKHQEKEQMSQPQEEFLEPKSSNSKEKKVAKK